MQITYYISQQKARQPYGNLTFNPKNILATQEVNTILNKK